jgi:hypothetical protein
VVSSLPPNLVQATRGANHPPATDLRAAARPPV